MYGYALFSALLHPVGGVRPGSGQICPTTWYTCSISNTRARTICPLDDCLCSLFLSIHRYNDNAISMRRLPDCSSALWRSLSRSNSIISRGASSKAPSKCEEKGRNEGRSRQKCTALAAYLFNVAIVGDEGLSLMAAMPRRRALIFTAIPRPQ